MTSRARFTSEFGRACGWSDTLASILEGAVAAVEPGRLVRAGVNRPAIRELLGAGPVRVFAIGKAAAPMARGALTVLGSRALGGLVVTKVATTSGALAPLERMSSGHPVPDARSLRAGARLLELAGRRDTDAPALVLLSGGASALVCAPLPPVTLADLRALTRLLLSVDADIHAINTIRRELDRVKGGGLARALARAPACTLILSDVDAARWRDVGSGPTVQRQRAPARAIETIAALGLTDRVPARVLAALRAAAGRPAPAAAAEHPCVVIGDSRDATRAARARAEEYGLTTIYDDTPLVGEASDRGRALALALDRSAREPGPPRCVIAGGETTVTLRGPGRGGRNQELALAAALELERLGARHGPRAREVVLAALATDGEDGPTDAAGAIVTGTTAARCRAGGVEPSAALARNDSYAALAAAGDLLRTGSTETNVRDLVVALTR